MYILLLFNLYHINIFIWYFTIGVPEMLGKQITYRLFAQAPSGLEPNSNYNNSNDISYNNNQLIPMYL